MPVCTPEQAKKLVERNVGSLEELCKRAICTADFNLMLAMGFPEAASRKLCDIVRKKASEMGIDNLERHYSRSLSGGSNIINTIVRRFHRLYFATRANLHPIHLLQHLSGGKEDICSALFEYSMKRSPESLEKRRKILVERAKASKKMVETFAETAGLEMDDEGEISNFFDEE